jgi:hypothetical protein
MKDVNRTEPPAFRVQGRLVSTGRENNWNDPPSGEAG